MKSWFPFLASMLCASVALADPLPPLSREQRQDVSALIDKQLLAPMAKRASRRSKFSRAAPPPVVRRVRVQEALLTDVHGDQFVRFSIDQRYAGDEEGDWSKDRHVGCVYPDQRKIFIESEGSYLPARVMLGQAADAQPDVCVPVPLGAAAAAEVARS